MARTIGVGLYGFNPHDKFLFGGGIAIYTMGYEFRSERWVGDNAVGSDDKRIVEVDCLMIFSGDINEVSTLAVEAVSVPVMTNEVRGRVGYESME